MIPLLRFLARTGQFRSNQVTKMLMLRLVQLKYQHAAKLREIWGMIAKDLGLGSFDGLSSQDREGVEEEAEDARERWMGACIDNPILKPVTPLQKLLAEHFELGEQILDLE